MKKTRYISRQSQAELVEKYRMAGESEAFLDTMELVSAAAKINRPVLIIGERGTGKELVAARLHYLSPRWQKPKISINCAAFAENLLEAEIFGYEPGAFTGAVKTKPGRLEMAHEGTLFLDELAQSPMALQEKILRALEYGEFERVGGVETLHVDTRVIAATNQDLPQLCEEGRFRHDLLDRLSFEVITLPPLRHRQEDIPLLAMMFAGRMAHEMECIMPDLSQRAMENLLDYHWPGNIRELKNVIERAVYRSQGEPIDEISFDPFESPYRPTQRIGRAQPVEITAPVPQIPVPAVVPAREKRGHEPEEIRDLPRALENLERKFVNGALEMHQFNQRKAADQLGLSYYQFRRLLKRINPNQDDTEE